MDDELDWRAEVLSRAPMQVSDETTPESLVDEMTERLSALMASCNGVYPTEEGWRQLAIELALRYHPAFKIETPADRTGRSGKGGKPVGFENFAVRSAMKNQIGKGLTRTEAAKIVAKMFGIAPGTARNSLTRKAPPPDFLARQPYEIKAENALLLAAKMLAQK
ncbi:hypothetical protein C5L14_23195 [Labrys okinawensis]|uniref:Uncharacterized protein n=1 Tax=Labrys okinawensis TaxID=346911 RepID=A0A2S9Q7N1_9HYPH|nr:hypothetical protein [Labrys okinawensis]PRH85349.1 hypothetical protein C5L14_23195 [Labrys okinawensis]